MTQNTALLSLLSQSDIQGGLRSKFMEAALKLLPTSVWLHADVNNCIHLTFTLFSPDMALQVAREFK